MDDIEDGRMEVLEAPKRPRTPVTPDLDMEVLDLSAVLGMLDEVCSAFGGPENVTLQKISSVYTVH